MKKDVFSIKKLEKCGIFVTGIWRRVILKVSICRNVYFSNRASDILKMECYD